MTSKLQQVPGDWDVYWTGSHENAAHMDGGAQAEALETFWRGYFTENSRREGEIRLLDMACGNGAVTGFAIQSTRVFSSFCLDTSLSALLVLGKRYPQTRCVVANALDTPFHDQSFDLIVSQFGIEYAGIDSFDEAARLLAPGGSLGAVIHLHDGAIYHECRDNLRAIERITKSKLLSLARDVFKAGFALNAGSGSIKVFKKAERKFEPAIRTLESILREMGPGVMAGLAQQLHRDIAHMYKRMSKFKKRDVINWLDGMENELKAYAGRMRSMKYSALRQAEFETVKQKLGAAGLVQQRCETLNMGPKQEAAAWLIVSKRC